MNVHLFWLLHDWRFILKCYINVHSFEFKFVCRFDKILNTDLESINCETWILFASFKLKWLLFHLLNFLFYIFNFWRVFLFKILKLYWLCFWSKIVRDEPFWKSTDNFVFLLFHLLLCLCCWLLNLFLLLFKLLLFILFFFDFSAFRKYLINFWLFNNLLLFFVWIVFFISLLKLILNNYLLTNYDFFLLFCFLFNFINFLFVLLFKMILLLLLTGLFLFKVKLIIVILIDSNLYSGNWAFKLKTWIRGFANACTFILLRRRNLFWFFRNLDRLFFYFHLDFFFRLLQIF